MKKQTILGLAVCALSFGAVAGVLSTRAVTETNAVTSNYYLHGQYAGSWDWRDLDLEHDDVKDEYYVTGLQLQDWAAFGFKQKDVSASWWSWSILEDEVKTGGNFQDKDGNIQVKEGKGGYYDIYFKLTDSAPSSIWIGENTSVVEHNVTEWIVTDGVKAGSSNVVKVADGGVPAASGAGYGQTFDGWFTDEACTSAFSGTVTSDITLYGKVTSVTTTETYHIDVSAVSAFATPYYYVWDASGSKAAWPGEAATGVSAGKFDLTVKSSTQGLIITDGAASGTKQTVDITTLDDGETITVLDEKDDGGKYKVNITGAAAPTIANGAYLVGTHNEWAQDDDSKTETPNEGDHGKWSNVTLAANVEFKIVIGDGSTESWLGFDSIGDDKSKVGFHKNETEGPENNNIVVDTAGSYNIFLNSENKIYISSATPAPTPTYANGTFLVGTHNEWAQDDASKSLTPEGEDHGKWSNVTLAANTEFKIVSGDGSSESWFGFDSIGNDASKVGFHKNTEEGAGNNNIVVDTAGTYNIFLNKDNQIFIVNTALTGHTVKIGDAANQSLEVSSETGEFVAAYKLEGVSLTAGQSIVFYEDATPITKIGGDGEDLDNANNMVKGGTDEAPTFTVQVTAASANIYLKKWNDGGYSFWITGRQSYRDDVKNFVATYITEQAKEAKPGDSCADKFAAAKTALEALNPIAQDGFATDKEFATAYAAYTYWKDHKDAGLGVKNPGWPMGDRNATLVIAGSVFLAGVIIAGAMIYFSHKRKSEK